MHTTLSRAEQAHGEEKSRLADEHHAAREELASSKLRIGEIETRLADAIELHEKTKAKHLQAMETQRGSLESDFQAELGAQQANLKAEFQAELETQQAKLKAEFQAELETQQAKLEADFQAELETQQAKLAAEFQAEVVTQQAKLAAEFQAELETQRAKLAAEFQAELETQRGRHAEQIAVLQAQAEANVRLIERLKAEVVTIAQSRSAPDADLAAAREEIADLRAKLADTEITKRSMSSLLEGMGIRLH